MSEQWFETEVKKPLQLGMLDAFLEAFYDEGVVWNALNPKWAISRFLMWMAPWLFGSRYVRAYQTLKSTRDLFAADDPGWKDEFRKFLEAQGPVFREHGGGKRALEELCPFSGLREVYRQRLQLFAEDVFIEDKKARFLFSSAHRLIDAAFDKAPELKELPWEQQNESGSWGAVRVIITNSGLAYERIERFCPASLQAA